MTRKRYPHLPNHKLETVSRYQNTAAWNIRFSGVSCFEDGNKRIAISLGSQCCLLYKVTFINIQVDGD